MQTIFLPQVAENFSRGAYSAERARWIAQNMAQAQPGRSVTETETEPDEEEWLRFY